MTTVIQSFSDDEKETLKILAKALEPFRSLWDTIPLQYAQTFLAIAIKEDMTINEISAATGIAGPTTSRQCSDLGEINRYHQPGFDLVSTRADVMDRRFNRTRLTPRGRALAGQVLKALGKVSIQPREAVEPKWITACLRD